MLCRHFTMNAIGWSVAGVVGQWRVACSHVCPTQRQSKPKHKH